MFDVLDKFGHDIENVEITLEMDFEVVFVKEICDKLED